MSLGNCFLESLKGGDAKKRRIIVIGGKSVTVLDVNHLVSLTLQGYGE